MAYSSDGGNGQAGYGWNIVGLSLITRGGKSKNIDGVYEGPQFDESDPYYLDGQRLIGFDEQSPDTAVTEVFSTIKVSKINEGNYKFMVQYPDGKIAKYVYVAPRQYAVGLIIDSYGNEIEYEYKIDNNTFYLESILYGKTNGTHPFTITFVRENKNQPIKAYRNGLTYINNKILKAIIVSSNQEGTYRKYILTHDTSSSGQERLKLVDVENKEGDRLKSLKFNYSDKSAYRTEFVEENNRGLSFGAKSFGKVATGDFEGDGIISSIYVANGNRDDKLISSNKGVLKTKTYYNTDLFAGKIIGINGNVTERDMLISIDRDFINDEYINGGYFKKFKVRINAEDIVTNQSTSIYFYLNLGYYEDGFSYCGNLGYDDYDVQKFSPNKFPEPLIGDFNSDGLLDVIYKIEDQFGLSSKNYLSPCSCRNFEDGCPVLSGKIKYNSYFIEIGKLFKDGGEINLNNYEFNAENLNIDLEHYPIEFDGDGFPEILQLNKQKGEFEVLKFNYKTKSIDIILPQFKLLNFENKTPLIFGDYNGDGLTDFLTPNKLFELTQNNNINKLIPQIENSQLIWKQYLSDGKTYQVSERDFTEQGLAHCVPSARDYAKLGGSFLKKLWSGPTIKYDYSEYGSCVIIPVDFNNDGKTDIATFKKFGKIKFNESITKSSEPISINKTITKVVGEKDEELFEYCLRDCIMDIPYHGGSERSCYKYCEKEAISTEQVETLVANKLVFFENIYDKNNEFTFKVEGSSSIDIGNIKISPYSFFINSQENNGLDSYKSKLLLHDPRMRKNYVFLIDSKEFFENRINEIDNGSGVVQQIEYIPLQNTLISEAGKNEANCNYNYNTEGLNLPFPYFVHKQVPAKFMVSKINTLFDDKAITKEYRYENAVQHLDGKGFLGFQKTYISDPYESKLYQKSYVPKDITNPIFWKINVYDPKIDDQLIETRYGELKGDYFTKSQINYTKYTKDNSPNSNLKKHQYIYHTTQEVNHDRIKDITIEKLYQYDINSDLLLLKSLTNYNGQGHSITSFGYKPAWNVGKHFYNGKIESVTETINAYEDAFTTREEYSDFNKAGIAQTHIKYGHNTSPITTKVAYNKFGNKFLKPFRQKVLIL